MDQLKADGAGRIIMVCVVAAPEGIALLNSKHPDVPIVAGVIDRQLNERKVHSARAGGLRRPLVQHLR